MSIRMITVDDQGRVLDVHEPPPMTLTAITDALQRLPPITEAQARRMSARLTAAFRHAAAEAVHRFRHREAHHREDGMTTDDETTERRPPATWTLTAKPDDGREGWTWRGEAIHVRRELNHDVVIVTLGEEQIPQHLKDRVTGEAEDRASREAYKHGAMSGYTAEQIRCWAWVEHADQMAVEHGLDATAVVDMIRAGIKEGKKVGAPEEGTPEPTLEVRIVGDLGGLRRVVERVTADEPDGRELAIEWLDHLATCFPGSGGLGWAQLLEMRRRIDAGQRPPRNGSIW